MANAALEKQKLSNPWQRPVTALYGVARERAELLKKLEIGTVEDLLLHRPKRYEDRRMLKSIAELQAGDLVTVRGTIVNMGVKWFRMRSQSIFELVVDDGTARLYCRWWNLPYLEKNFQKGEDVVVCGKLKEGKP